MSKKSVLEKTLRRNTHRHWIEVALGKSPRGHASRKVIHAYLSWVFAKLSAGERVQLPQVGTITAKFRKGRVIKSTIGMTKKPVTIVHKPTFAVRLDASRPLRQAMIALAASVDDPKSVFKGVGGGKGRRQRGQNGSNTNAGSTGSNANPSANDSTKEGGEGAKEEQVEVRVPAPGENLESVLGPEDKTTVGVEIPHPTQIPGQP